MPQLKPIRGSLLKKPDSSPAGRMVDSLVAYYLLNGGTGNTVFDLSGNRNIGTFGNTPIWIGGDTGRAIDFDIGDYINCGDSAILNGVTALTVIAKVKPASLTDFPIIVGKWNQKTGDDWRQWKLVAAFNTGNPYIDITNLGTGDIYRQGTSALGTTEDTTIAGVFNGAAQTLDFYRNGVLDNGTLTGTVPSSIYATNQAPCYIADSTEEEVAQGGIQRYSGKIEYICIFNQALSASEIALLYREPFCMVAEKENKPRIFSVAAIGVLTGTVAAQSTISGSLEVTKKITGAITAQSNISGDIEVAKEITGVCAAQSVVSGTLSVKKNLTGAITATSGVNADLTTFAFLSGTIITNSIVSSPGLEVLKNLTGQIQASGSVAGNILVIKLLTGNVLTTSNIIGELSGTGVVESEIDLPDDWLWIADMIDEGGRDVSIIVPSGAIDSNKPWRGNTPGTPVSAKGIFVRHTSREKIQDHVKRQEQHLLIAPASNITISEGTKIVDSIDNSDWYVKDFQKITEETGILLYILEVRQ